MALDELVFSFGESKISLRTTAFGEGPLYAVQVTRIDPDKKRWLVYDCKDEYFFSHMTNANILEHQSNLSEISHVYRALFRNGFVPFGKVSGDIIFEFPEAKVAIKRQMLVDSCISPVPISVHAKGKKKINSQLRYDLGKCTFIDMLSDHLEGPFSSEDYARFAEYNWEMSSKFAAYDAIGAIRTHPQA